MRCDPLRVILNAGYYKRPVWIFQVLRFYDHGKFRIVFMNTEIHSIENRLNATDA